MGKNILGLGLGLGNFGNLQNFFGCLQIQVYGLLSSVKILASYDKDLMSLTWEKFFFFLFLTGKINWQVHVLYAHCFISFLKMLGQGTCKSGKLELQY